MHAPNGPARVRIALFRYRSDCARIESKTAITTYPRLMHAHRDTIFKNRYQYFENPNQCKRRTCNSPNDTRHRRRETPRTPREQFHKKRHWMTRTPMSSTPHAASREDASNGDRARQRSSSHATNGAPARAGADECPRARTAHHRGDPAAARRSARSTRYAGRPRRRRTSSCAGVRDDAFAIGPRSTSRRAPRSVGAPRHRAPRRWSQSRPSLRGATWFGAATTWAPS